MQYVEFTGTLHQQLIAEGYKFLIQLYLPLSDKQVGFEGGPTFSHFELIPAAEQPIDFDMDKGAYYDIESPEALGFASGDYIAYFWINKKHL